MFTCVIFARQMAERADTLVCTVGDSQCILPEWWHDDSRSYMGVGSEGGQHAIIQKRALRSVATFERGHYNCARRPYSPQWHWQCRHCQFFSSLWQLACLCHFGTWKEFLSCLCAFITQLDNTFMHSDYMFYLGFKGKYVIFSYFSHFSQNDLLVVLKCMFFTFQHVQCRSFWLGYLAWLSPSFWQIRKKERPLKHVKSLVPCDFCGHVCRSTYIGSCIFMLFGVVRFIVDCTCACWLFEVHQLVACKNGYSLL